MQLIRICGLQPFSELIDKCLASFRDEQDRGLLTLTHIYLLVGCSLPLWLAPNGDSQSLTLFSGIISVGVGDMAASVVGSLYGRHKWPGSRKSYEGSAAAVAAQVLFSTLLWTHITSSLPSLSHVVAVAVAGAVSAFVEANTQQIDNLILPLYHNIVILLAKIIVPDL